MLYQRSETQREWDAPFLEQTLRARLQNFLTSRIQNLSTRQKAPTSCQALPQHKHLHGFWSRAQKSLWKVSVPNTVCDLGSHLEKPTEKYQDRALDSSNYFQIDVPGVLSGGQGCSSCSLLPALQAEAPPRISSWSLGQDFSSGSSQWVPLPHWKPSPPVASIKQDMRLSIPSDWGGEDEMCAFKEVFIVRETHEITLGSIYSVAFHQKTYRFSYPGACRIFVITKKMRCNTRT